MKFDLGFLLDTAKRYFRLRSELWCRYDEECEDFDSDAHSSLMSEEEDVYVLLHQICDAWNVGLSFDASGWPLFVFDV